MDVDVDVEEEVEPVDEPPVDPEDPEAGAHDSETPTTGSFTGSGIDDSGVPAGTLTEKDRCWPPSTVTVTTHESADAEGIAATPRIPSIVLRAITPATSFRLLNTIMSLLPPYTA
ncbi:MAG: hypothetical protein ACYC91_15355 [Solirubrobacteraceae bacterium]